MFGRRYYLLMDGMHSCAYLPRRTYRKLTRMLEKSLEQDPKAENSLRFLWTRKTGHGSCDEYLCVVNPDLQGGMMNCTHGLVKDDKGRILIPCPYVQEIYARFGVEPGWCGRVEVRFLPTHGKALAEMVLAIKN